MNIYLRIEVDKNALRTLSAQSTYVQNSTGGLHLTAKQRLLLARFGNSIHKSAA